MRAVRDFLVGLVLATLALVILLGMKPIATDTIVAGYAVAVAALALANLTRAMRELTDSPASRFDAELERRTYPPSRPTALLRVERELTLAMSSAGHAHERILPLLREIAEARLGLDLARRPDSARERLGDETWGLLRPDLPAPDDRHGPGVPLRRIRSAVDALERL